jgi:hypothetical protein
MEKLKFFGALILLFIVFQFGRIYDLGSKSKSIKELNQEGKVTWYNGDIYYIMPEQMDGNTVLTNKQAKNLYNISDYETPVIILTEPRDF